MSFADDAPDFAPARTKSRGGLFTPLVWISVGSALTCIVLALVFMAFAPKLFGPKPAAPAPPGRSRRADLGGAGGGIP